MKKSAHSKNINRKLAVYSATAGAVMAIAPAAKADIKNITAFSLNAGVSFELTPPSENGNPPNQWNSVRFTAASAAHSPAFYGQLSFFGRPATRFAFLHGFIAKASTRALASNLASGASIAKTASGGNRNFGQRSGGGLELRTLGGGYAVGRFLPIGANAAKTGYVGFKTNLHSNADHGWLRVQVSNDAAGLPVRVSLVDKNNDGIYGAFALPSDNLKAGQVVPEPSLAQLGGLALLALGAAGIREFRRRKQTI